MTTIRNPLTVPVAEATIDELSAQARHHALIAASAGLEQFHSDEYSDFVMHHPAWSPLQTIRVHMDRMTVYVLTLATTEEGVDLVRFLDPYTGRADYGALEDNVLYPLSVLDIHLVFGDDILLTMGWKLHHLITTAGVIAHTADAD